MEEAKKRRGLDLDESNFPSLKVRLRFPITDISILVVVHVLP